MKFRSAILYGAFALSLGCSEPPARDYESMLRGATRITIDERVSIGKDYLISADGEPVATVSGKDLNLIGGDMFTLRTLDGKVLASEKEQKRFFRLNRTAVVYDRHGDVSGHFGEEKIDDMLSVGFIMHFYDAARREVGRSRTIGKGVISDHEIQDSAGNADYEVDKQFKIANPLDYYVLTVKDPLSKIPLEHAILMVCVRDAISDES